MGLLYMSNSCKITVSSWSVWAVLSVNIQNIIAHCRILKISIQVTYHLDYLYYNFKQPSYERSGSAGEEDADSVLEQAMTQARHSEDNGILSMAKQEWVGEKESRMLLAKESHSVNPDMERKCYGSDCLVSVSDHFPCFAPTVEPPVCTTVL